MKFTFRTLAALCSVAVAFNTGCSDSGSGNDSSDNVTPIFDGANKSDTASIQPVSADKSDLSEPSAVTAKITFDSGSAAVDGASGVKVSGSTVTINSAGVYQLSGSSTDGKVIVDCDKDSEVTLMLNGLDLTSASGSAIVCEKAKKLTLWLCSDSENVISDTANYTFAEGETEPDAAVYSKCDMVISGFGRLTVNGNYADAIKCKDGLKLCTEEAGAICVNSVGDGIKGRDYVALLGGAVTVNCGGDGIKSTNSENDGLGYISIESGTVSITSGQDAIQAETELLISGGTINAITGGGSETVQLSTDGEFDGRHGGFFMEGGKPFDFGSLTNENGEQAVSMKGLKAGSRVIIDGGKIDADCADDAIHANGSVTINSGDISLASGDDGIHSDVTLTINDGEIYISSSYEGLEAKSVEINGGTIDLTAFDDGINAGGGDNGGFLGMDAGSDEYFINITGGSVTVNAAGDGIDSNGTIALSGGSLVVFGPTNGANGAIDYNNSFAVSGGTLIALGSRQMAQAPSTMSQPCLSIYANAAAGSEIEVRSADGTVVIGVETPKAVESLIFSSDKFVVGEAYSIYCDSTLLAQVTAEDGVSGGGASGSGFGNFGGRPVGEVPRDKPSGDYPKPNRDENPDGTAPSDNPFGGRGHSSVPQDAALTAMIFG